MNINLELSEVRHPSCTMIPSYWTPPATTISLICPFSQPYVLVNCAFSPSTPWESCRELQRRWPLEQRYGGGKSCWGIGIKKGWEHSSFTAWNLISRNAFLCKDVHCSIVGFFNILFIYFLAVPRGLQDISSPTRI